MRQSVHLCCTADRLPYLLRHTTLSCITLQYIQDAIREFEGTSEEVRVTVADCELAIARGDVEGALKKLRRIPNTSPHYVKARMAMADIYLRHRKDKTAYIKCYMDLVVSGAGGRGAGLQRAVLVG